MTSPRFRFPTPALSLPVASAPAVAFVPVPAAVCCQMTIGQLAATQELYRIAWERTQAALAPSPVEKLYRVSAN